MGKRVNVPERTKCVKRPRNKGAAVAKIAPKSDEKEWLSYFGTCSVARVSCLQFE
jgi:hypothetical protein